jgi:hypothetical protein
LNAVLGLPSIAGINDRRHRGIRVAGDIQCDRAPIPIEGLADRE